MTIADRLSPQAKAVWSAVLIFLAQVAVFVGSGGVAEVAAITLGQWIQIVIATSVAYGVTYNVPNTDKAPVEGEDEPVAVQPLVAAPAPVADPVMCTSTMCGVSGPHPAH